jgi:DNA modification methylase
MAPELVWEEMPDDSKSLQVLDPMAGSGTTLVGARLRGHHATGFDRDPLAVMIAKAWISVVDTQRTERKAAEVIERAKRRAVHLRKRSSYPARADEETRNFIDFWFDADNRKELTALAASIEGVRDEVTRNLLWCAFSRMIITKEAGVSLAMDVSHSRPHRVFDLAPHGAFDRFARAVRYVTRLSPFRAGEEQGTLGGAVVSNEDARKLPVADATIDLVITSPPYLNAIDYMRGHKLSLVWMGFNIAALRLLRATNMGSEVAAPSLGATCSVEEIAKAMCSGEPLDRRREGILRRYVQDLHSVLSECYRVLRPVGKGVFVCGDSTLRGTFIANSTGVELVARKLGFKVIGTRRRALPENKRYLPPPEKRSAGAALAKRMREEVIVSLQKPADG